MKAQIAAGAKGVQDVHKMIDQFGLDVVHAYMRHVQDNAEEQVRRVIDVMQDGEFTYPTDEGAEIKVKISFKRKNDPPPWISQAPAIKGLELQCALGWPVRRSCTSSVAGDDKIPLNEGA